MQPRHSRWVRAHAIHAYRKLPARRSGGPHRRRRRDALASGMSDQPPHVEIPLDRLKDDLITAIVDDFVLREGTDYGHAEISLESKRRQVRAQLRDGSAALMFDPQTETCTIVLRAP